MAKINLAGMDVPRLIELREQVEASLAEHRKILQQQIDRLTPAQDRSGKSLKGRKVAAKYRSRKDRSLTWAGRGATPLWMREEMKANKLKKDAFLIK